jgi:hypothetical protein
MVAVDREPPTKAGWNLALRFALEVLALAGLAVGAWALTDGALRWVACIVVPLLAAVAWGTFNVPGDPSRSGRGPVAVIGRQRLLVEVVVLGLGSAALLYAAPLLGLVVVCGVVVHDAAGWSRVAWLLGSS